MPGANNSESKVDIIDQFSSDAVEMLNVLERHGIDSPKDIIELTAEWLGICHPNDATDGSNSHSMMLAIQYARQQKRTLYGPTT
jgi:hypothetical protein